jgi:hypothetical protein
LNVESVEMLIDDLPVVRTPWLGSELMFVKQPVSSPGVAGKHP